MGKEYIKVYTPESSIIKPWSLITGIIGGFREGRFLAWRLFVRNFNAQYRQSLLGIFWAFLPPLVSGLVWVFLQEQKVFTVASTPIPYPAFVLTGTILWQVFMDSINVPMGVIMSSKMMMTKINFPREALLLTGIYQVLLNLGIKVILLIGVYTWFRIGVGPNALLSLVGIAIMILFGVGFSLCLTPLAMLYGDVKRSLSIVLQFLFFLTPIIYPTPKEGFAKVIAELNPAAHLITTTRDWLTLGHASNVTSFIIVGGIGLIFLIIGLVLYKLTLPIIIERIGS